MITNLRHFWRATKGLLAVITTFEELFVGFFAFRKGHENFVYLINTQFVSAAHLRKISYRQNYFIINSDSVTMHNDILVHIHQFIFINNTYFAMVAKYRVRKFHKEHFNERIFSNVYDKKRQYFFLVNYFKEKYCCLLRFAW